MCTTEYEEGTALDAEHTKFAAHAEAQPLRSLADIIRRVSNVLPNHVAVRSGDQERTYAEVDLATRQLASMLFAHGVQPGDRVGLYLHKSVESYIAIHGVLLAGAVYVPIDPLAPAAMVDVIADDCGIDVLITADNKRRSFGDFAHNYQTFIGTEHAPNATAAVPWSTVFESDLDAVPSPPELDDPAYIIYTSGSTGTPKGIVRSHGFLLAQDKTLGPSLNLQPGQIDLVTLPVFLLSNLAHGVTSVIADTDLTKPGFPDIPKILSQVSQHQITRCTASPAFFEKMPDEFFDSLDPVMTDGLGQ